jgi:hypothetical protein
VGDAAYVDSAFMITPYIGINLHITHPPKDWFNYWQSQIRITIERCFGIFVARWGIFWQPLQYKLEDIVEIVQACCRLHNFATKYQLPIIHDVPIHASRDENGVLRDSGWRNVRPFEESFNIRSGSNALKENLLCEITRNHDSHER